MEGEGIEGKEEWGMLIRVMGYKEDTKIARRGLQLFVSCQYGTGNELVFINALIILIIILDYY